MQLQEDEQSQPVSASMILSIVPTQPPQLRPARHAIERRIDHDRGMDQAGGRGASGLGDGQSPDRAEGVGLIGVEEAKNKANQLIENAKSRISVFGSSAWRLTWLATYVLERTH